MEAEGRISWEVPPTAPPVERWTEVATDEEGRLALDVPCRACAYNLRGLRPEGECPECHTPIERSVRGDLLIFSDPDWVQRLALGCTWLIWGIFVSIGLGLLMGVGIAMVVGMSGGAAALPTPLLIALVVIALAMGAAQLVGYWLLTARDPGQDESERPVNARSVARAAIIGSIAASATASAISPTGLSPTFGPITAVVLVGLLAGFGGEALWLIGFVALCVHMRRLARRLASVRLEHQTGVVMWGLSISMGLSAAVQLTQQLTFANWMGRGPPIALMLFAGGGCFVAVGTLVFGIWAIVLLFRFRRAFAGAAREARQHWARGAEREEDPGAASA